MSIAETTDIPDKKFAGGMVFVQDERGRSLFYPSGTAWSGYVVPDAARERALRCAIERYAALNKRLFPWGALVLPFALYPLYGYFSSRPFLAIGSVVLEFVLLVLAGAAIKRYQLRAELDGLERVDRRDGKPRRRLIILALWLATAGAIAELTLRLYQGYNDALPAVAGTTIYYAGISLSLALALIFGSFALLILSGWRGLVKRIGQRKVLLCYFVSLILCVFFVGDVAVTFLDPTPYVVVGSNGTFCGWRIPWSKVTGIDLISGARGSRYAWLQTGPASQGSFWLRGNGKSCDISELNEDYAVVYGTIRRAWQSSRADYSHFIPLQHPQGARQPQ